MTLETQEDATNEDATTEAPAIDEASTNSNSINKTQIATIGADPMSKHTYELDTDFAHTDSSDFLDTSPENSTESSNYLSNILLESETQNEPTSPYGKMTGRYKEVDKPQPMKQRIRSDGDKFVLHDEKRVHFGFQQDNLKQEDIPHDIFEGIALDSDFQHAQPDANYVDTTEHVESPYKNNDPFEPLNAELFPELRKATRHTIAKDFKEIDQDLDEIDQDLNKANQELDDTEDTFEPILPDFSNEKPFVQNPNDESWQTNITSYEEDPGVRSIEDEEYHADLVRVQEADICLLRDDEATDFEHITLASFLAYSRRYPHEDGPFEDEYNAFYKAMGNKATTPAVEVTASELDQDNDDRLVSYHQVNQLHNFYAISGATPEPPLLEKPPSTTPGSPKPAITLANHIAALHSPQEPSSEGAWVLAAKKGNKKKGRKSRNKKKAATPATPVNVKTFLNKACNVLSPARYSKEDTSSASSQSKAESTSSNLTSTSNTDLDHTENQEQTRDFHQAKSD
jgi:hypothetical protein